MGKTLASLASLANEPPTPEARTPSLGASQRPVPLDQIAFNPLNKRNVHAHPDKIKEMGESLLKVGQLSPCAVVTRADFLRIFPEHQAAIGAAAYVQCPGARRLAAARLKGISMLDVVVKPKLATDRATWLAATTMENTDREDLDPIEEAHQVQELVSELGQSNLAAERLGKEPAWITTRTNRLKLTPEVQRMLSTKEVSHRKVRDIHDLSPELQLLVVRLRNRETLAIDSETKDVLGRRFKDLSEIFGWAESKPGVAESGPVPVQRRGRPTAVVAFWRKLGETPDERAAKLYAEIDQGDLRALYARLGTLLNQGSETAQD